MIPPLGWEDHILEQELLTLVKSFLKKRSVGATADECFAWEEFYFTYDLVIRGSVGKLHKALHVIDDVAQDVWIVLIRKLPKWVFDPGLGSIGAWVMKIAHRLAVKRVRRHAREQAEPLGGTGADKMADPEPGPDVELEQMQEHELFAALVSEFAQGLTTRDREIVLLRFLKSWDFLEIARELKASDSCIRSVVHRVSPKLRDFPRRRGLRPV
jgi:RNA polymerase sigma factor (sigma-70 family)